MKLSFIISALEDFAPLALQESWDNSGLQLSLPPEASGDVAGVMVCLDVTEEIIAEAQQRGCNLIVSHHPLIFKGIKSITGRNATERIVAAAIRGGVAVYSSHTALDSTRGGISYRMAEMLGASVTSVLAPADNAPVKIEVTCPRPLATDVRLTLLGDIDSCDYYEIDADSTTNGDTVPDEPFDIADIIRHTPLCRVEATTTAPKAAAMRRHLKLMPGGEMLKIAVSPLAAGDDSIGLGVIANYDSPISGADLVERLHKVFGTPAIRASLAFDADMPIRRIALCGGAGGEFIAAAKGAGAQAYITADVRYHDMADNATSPMAIFDIGHFESEICAKDIFISVLKNKFPDLTVIPSEVEKVPVKYL